MTGRCGTHQPVGWFRQSSLNPDIFCDARLSLSRQYHSYTSVKCLYKETSLPRSGCIYPPPRSRASQENYGVRARTCLSHKKIEYLFVASSAASVSFSRSTGKPEGPSGGVPFLLVRFLWACKENEHTSVGKVYWIASSLCVFQ